MHKFNIWKTVRTDGNLSTVLPGIEVLRSDQPRVGKKSANGNFLSAESLFSMEFPMLFRNLLYL